jgi:imidazoleglycerol-phosphate dehydratase
MLKKRTAVIKRKTRETDISAQLNLDGSGKYDIKTGIGFLDHMLELFSKHGLFDITLRAKGDLRVDMHHTNEDVGICLGEVFKKAWADKKGIRRFGWAAVPMDEALVEVTLDISGRPYLRDLISSPSPTLLTESVEHYSFNDAKEFLRAFINNAGINMIFNIKAGEDLHHILEALFKAFARALDEATQLDPRIKGVPSTKGRL